MPFLPMDWTEEQKQQGLNVSGSGANGTDMSGGSAGIGTKSSGSWVNLNKYLDANKEQGQGIGEKVAGTVNQSGQEAKSAIDQTKNEFNQALESGTIKNLGTAKNEGTNIVNTAKTLVDPSDANRSFSKKITTGGPSSLRDEDLSRWDEITNAQYKGPENYSKLGSFSGTGEKLSKLNNNLQNLDTESGRNTLLTQSFNNPGYSYGERGLDNMLMSGNDMAKQALAKSKEDNKSVSSDWQLAQDQGAALAGERKTVLDDLRNWSKEFVQQASANKEQESDISASANKNAVDRIAKNIKDYQDGKSDLSPETLKYMNLGTQTQVFNVDPSQFLGASDPRLAVSRSQAIQLDALNKLAKSSGLAPTTKYETDPNKVGGDVFNEAGFKEATAQAGKDYQTAFNSEPAIDFQGKLMTPAKTREAIDSRKALIGNENYAQESLIASINNLESQLSAWMQSKGVSNSAVGSGLPIGIPNRLLGGK